MPIIGTPTAVTGGSGSYAPESGSNRIVVFTVSKGTTDTGSNITPTLSTFTYGSSTIANGQIVVAKQAGVGLGANFRAWIGYILEANLPGSAQTPTITWSDTMVGSDLIMAFTLGGMDQASPVDGSGVTETHSSNTDPWTGSLTIADNCIQILTFGNRSSGASSTSGAGWTEVQDTSNSSTRHITQYTTGQPAGSLSYTADLTSTTVGALVAASFKQLSSNWPQYTHRHSTIITL